MNRLRLSRIVLPSILGAGLLLTGCSHPTYYAPPPPPPPGYAVPPMIVRAQEEGFRAGTQDGAWDVTQGFGHHPRADRKFRDTVGFEPGMGPFGPYRDAFRQAYLNGYEKAFYRR